MNTNMQWPFTQQPGTNITWTYGYLQQTDFEKIRTIIREEVHKALHPEEERPSATVECEQDGKRWRGTVYLIEDESEDDEV